MSLGNQIHELRKKNNLSQEQLAEKIGVARQTISKWELGETSPDIKQAQMLSIVFGVSLYEVLGNETREASAITQESNQESKKVKSVPWTKIIVIIAAVICLCLLAAGIFAVVNRWRILHPQGAEELCVITRKDSVLLSKGESKTVLFEENGKPLIMCQLPEGFVRDGNLPGVYFDESGNYIKFASDYAENIINPLFGTVYYSYYKDDGYHTYMDMARLAMYYDSPKLGILSSKEELHLAGGAQLMRSQLCAGQDADFYEIGGVLTDNGEETLIYGFALHFDQTVWYIILTDYVDNYYFITIKDPSGAGRSIVSVAELLSTVYAGNASERSEIMDTIALQNARNSFTQYIAEHIEKGAVEGCYVFQASNSRYVSFQNGNYVGIYYTMEEAIKAMVNDYDLTKLSPTDTEGLWIYESDT